MIPIKFIYKNNQQLKEIYKEAVKEKNYTLKEISEKLAIAPQQLNNKFNNKRFSFDDFNDLCNIIGKKIQIELIDHE